MVVRDEQGLEKIIYELKLDGQKNKEIKAFAEILDPENPESRLTFENLLTGYHLEIFKDVGKLKIFVDRVMKAKTEVQKDPNQNSESIRDQAMITKSTHSMSPVDFHGKSVGLDKFPGLSDQMTLTSSRSTTSIADNKESKKKKDSNSEGKIKGNKASQSQVTSGSWDHSSLSRRSSMLSLDHTTQRSQKSPFESSPIVPIIRNQILYDPQSTQTFKETSKKWIITGIIVVILAILAIIKWLL